MPTIVHINIITVSLSIDTAANFKKEGLLIPLPRHYIGVSCQGNDFVTWESIRGEHQEITVQLIRS